MADKQVEKTDSQQLAAELGFMCASTMVEAVQGPGGKMQCQPSKTAPICQKYRRFNYKCQFLGYNM